MSHSCYTNTFAENTTLKKMKDEINDAMLNEYDPLETPCGMRSNLILDNRIYDSYEEAKRVCGEYAGRYQDYGAKYKEYKIDKIIAKYDKKLKELSLEYKKFLESADIGKEKAEFRGCRHCGSKIAKKHLKRVTYNTVTEIPVDSMTTRTIGSAGEIAITSHKCPVCGEELWSNTNVSRLKSLKERYAKIVEEFNEAKKKGKYVIKWVVRADRHV